MRSRSRRRPIVGSATRYWRQKIVWHDGIGCRFGNLGHHVEAGTSFALDNSRDCRRRNADILGKTCWRKVPQSEIIKELHATWFDALIAVCQASSPSLSKIRHLLEARRRLIGPRARYHPITYCIEIYDANIGHMLK